MQLISATPKVAFNRRHPCGKNTRRQMTSRSISCINSRLRLIDLLFCRNAAKVIQENDSLKCNTSFWPFIVRQAVHKETYLISFASFTLTHFLTCHRRDFHTVSWNKPHTYIFTIQAAVCYTTHKSRGQTGQRSLSSLAGVSLIVAANCVFVSRRVT